MMLLALAGGLPAVAVAMVLLWTRVASAEARWTLTLVIVLCWVGFSLALRSRLIFVLNTLSNLLGAMRDGDFSLRARGARPGDAMGEVLREANALGDTLREQRLGAEEAAALLAKVMEEMDVAIFAFDSRARLRLVNRAGEKLLGRAAAELHEKTAGELMLADYLEGETERIVERAFPGRPQAGRWEVRRGVFRERGLRHTLLVIADLSRPLREEERQAWQRIVRVLGHELNNSLAPIKSMAGTLQGILARENEAPEWREDLRRGLGVISGRAESLARFMEAYAKLARLPQPRITSVNLGALIRRVASLETRIRARVAGGPEIVIQADADQLEQLLINLVRNAADAALETGGAVEIRWAENHRAVEIEIADEGPGLPNTANLFVPFFTTKPGGTGIGLALSRQIAESHGGALTLENRRAGPGCLATLRLPLSANGEQLRAAAPRLLDRE